MDTVYKILGMGVVLIASLALILLMVYGSYRLTVKIIEYFYSYWIIIKYALNKKEFHKFLKEKQGKDWDSSDKLKVD